MHLVSITVQFALAGEEMGRMDLKNLSRIRLLHLQAAHLNLNLDRYQAPPLINNGVEGVSS